jgi:aldehyde dehydrogenase (NAD+)
MSQTLSAQCYVDGKWVEGAGDLIRTISPLTGEVLAETPAADSALVAAALTSARRAFDGGAWSQVPADERGRMLAKLADLLERDREEIARLAAIELGTPVMIGGTLHVDLPVGLFRWFAEAATRGPRGGIEEHLPLHHTPILSSSMLLREPVGVVAAVVAFNVPIYMMGYKVGGALAAGCSVVLLTSPKAVLLTTKAVQLIEEAGFPAGAVNFVFGPPEITEQVVSADEVNLVTFTGSAAVGSKIAALAAPRFKRLVLELGGKSPNLLLPGTDVAGAVPASSLRFTRNTGQACGATTRIFVPRGDVDEYIDASAAFLATLPVGDPLDPATALGPLITAEHVGVVEGYLERARAEGALTPIGGGRPAGFSAGAFFEATLVTGASNSAEISREELFAPVGVVIPYDDVDEAIRMANDSRYALNANVWGPTSDAIDVARRIRSGNVTINGGSAMRPDVPWGGPGDSGIGREGGEEGYREFFELKHVQWPVR